MTEDEWQAQVVDLAHFYGHTVAHFGAAQTEKGWRTPARVDAKGFPDLVICRRGQVMFRELKTDRGQLTPEQEAWGIVLGDLWDVWRPRDFDRVKAELR